MMPKHWDTERRVEFLVWVYATGYANQFSYEELIQIFEDKRLNNVHILGVKPSLKRA